MKSRYEEGDEIDVVDSNDEQKIQELANKPNVYEVLAKSLGRFIILMIVPSYC